MIFIYEALKSRLKLCRTLDPTACFKWKQKKKILDSFLLAAIRFTLILFDTGVCQAIGMLSPAIFRCWTLRNPEK